MGVIQAWQNFTDHHAIDENPTIIGLTGLPCAGKSTLARILQASGARVIDVDKVGHRLIDAPEVAGELVKRFGCGVCREDGTVNRSEVARVVFSSTEELGFLERVLHPRMVGDIGRTVGEWRGWGGLAVLDAALLFQMGLSVMCGRIVVVTAAWEARLARARERDWGEDELRRRSARLESCLRAACNSGHSDIKIIDNSQEGVIGLERAARELIGEV